MTHWFGKERERKEVRRSGRVSPIRAAPCFTHVLLSSGIDAEVSSDVFHLGMETNSQKRWSYSDIEYIDI